MTFTSYAQNFEDVILRRALQGVENGVYIDVGANDPIVDSVTKAFYDLGWRGVNVEPVKEWHDRLEEERPEDINLHIAAGSSKGSLDFFDVVGTGLSTMNEDFANRHATERGYEVHKYKVPVVRLTSICEKHISTEIHFLKIDVEGAELAVLSGLDLKRFRPWILVIESTLPNLPVEDYEDWEPIILDADYEFVYFDGLNRFYVAKEHEDIKSKLNVPPNVFDNFILSGRANSSFHSQVSSIQQLLEEEKRERQLLDGVKERNVEVEGELSKLVDELEGSKKNTAIAENIQAQLKRELQGQRLENDRLKKGQAQSLMFQNKAKANLLAAEGMQNEYKEKVNNLQNRMNLKAKELGDVRDELQMIYTSKSWFVTKPLREASQMYRGLMSRPIRILLWPFRLFKRSLIYMIIKLMKYVLSVSKIRIKIAAFLDRTPRIKNRLRLIAENRGLISKQSFDQSILSGNGEEDVSKNVEIKDIDFFQKHKSPRVGINHKDKSPLEKWMY